MRVLILGECSGVGVNAFRAQGHDAFSVDIKNASHDFHFEGSWDAEFENPENFVAWDLVIWHAECTKLCVSGNHVYADGKPKHAERLAAMEYTRIRWDILKKFAKRAVLENSRGVLSRVIGPYSQSIQPYQFGEDASKTTDLWYHNVPMLKGTKRVPGRVVMQGGKQVERWANQTDSGQNRLGPSETRGAERAATYPGIADAWARQWGAACT